MEFISPAALQQSKMLLKPDYVLKCYVLPLILCPLENCVVVVSQPAGVGGETLQMLADHPLEVSPPRVLNAINAPFVKTGSASYQKYRTASSI